jgi:predicted TIM-barrel enzyme
MAGRGSAAGLLPYGDANAIVVEMAAEILPVVRSTPVLAGVCGTDPFRFMGPFLRQLQELGYSGVQNFPTVGLFEGRIRQNMEETGLGFGCEIEMIAEARRQDLFTSPYAFNPDEATRMADAGADMVVAHVGTTSTGMAGAATVMSIQEAIDVVGGIAEAAKEANPDVFVVCHGGPLATAAEAAQVIEAVTEVTGFYGASSMERLPVERAITDNLREFKSIGS